MVSHVVKHVGSQPALRQKTGRVVRILGRYLGIPRPANRRPPPLDLLVATILSQNTNDKNSHRAYTRLRERYPRWEDVTGAPLRGIESAIRSGGMARQKSRRIKEILVRVRTLGDGADLKQLKRMSDDRVLTHLTEFKGVGVKTAACVLLFSLGRDVFPVDTHVHRICNRLGLVDRCKLPEHTFAAMRSQVPPGKAYSFHTNLIRFGRRVCRSNNPSCSVCPLHEECIYPHKGRRTAGVGVSPTHDRDFMLLDNV